MKLKKTSLILASIAFCGMLVAGPAMAGKGHHGKCGNPDQRLERMTEKLGLSDAQADQIRTIMASNKPTMDQLKEQMKSTLTDEQRAAMKEQRKSHKKDGERPSKEDRAAQMQAIGVSQGQMQQMKSLREQMKTEHQAIQAEIASVLTPEQKAKVEEMKKNKKGQKGRRGQRK